MKKFSRILFCLGALLFTAVNMPVMAQQNPNAMQNSTRIGVINTKRCLEESKLGKQETANFEKMQTQMKSILEEKEKALEEVETKLNDEDYMDSVTSEVEADLKRKRKTIRQEGTQLQNQFLQTLQQANVKIMQKLSDTINKASTQVAKESANSNQVLDLIITDESTTYYSPQLDVTTKIVAKMDAIFDSEQKDNSSTTNSNSNKMNSPTTNSNNQYRSNNQQFDDRNY